MIDIHTHILPAVDDGSANIEQSLTMLKTLISQGVTDVVCTPHYRRIYKMTGEEIKVEFDKFKSKVEDEKLPVNLYLGREVYATDSIREEIRQDPRSFVTNNTRFILLEFDFNVPCEIVETVYELILKGYIPIVAHIERYNYLTIEQAYEIKENGGLIQINVDSIIGEGRKVYWKKTKELLKHDLVDFVASDSHWSRAVYMDEAYKFISKKFGEERAKKLFELNARKFIKG